MRPIIAPLVLTALSISDSDLSGATKTLRASEAYGMGNGESNMPLTTVIITIVAVGIVLWLVNRFIPMQSQVKSILNGLVVIVLVLWIGNLYGIFDRLKHFRVGH
jgi:hypothetical protein